MGYIYKITNNINQKMYIGKTESIDPYERWQQHKRDYKRTRNEKRPIYEAMNKYGIDNFTFAVIDECDSSEELCEKEKHYINLYRTYIGFKDCAGYNATLGGDGKSYLQLDESDIIRFHVENGMILGNTAKHYHVSSKAIKQILLKNNIKWLSNEQIIDKSYIETFGGLAMINPINHKIIHTYKNVRDVLIDYPQYNTKTLTLSSNPNDKAKHKAYGYLWYRFVDLPTELLEANNYTNWRDIIIDEKSS